ncbi:MAG: type IV toxin-antitoxin system AbiEi family antitoxin domain-containing protein, partial [Bacteroidales bacterium]|nr:type IV toxin-antitoxin system AbiEi family antitoxin domain-containing protein [Bacteroidales bacterium]
RVSSPELAFMECLLLAPTQYDYMDLYYIMEQLTSLRVDVVQNLLENVKNFRVKRLFLYMAEKAGHYWFDMLNFEKINLGNFKLQIVRNGVYIKKYRITIPKNLNDYE